MIEINNYIIHMATNNGWERFIHNNTRGAYKVSISKTGTIGLLSEFCLRENIKNFKRVVLFFNKAKMAIGIAFTNDDSIEGSFSITKNKSINTASVTAHSFFKAHRIKELVKDWGARIPRKEKDVKFGTMFVIDLFENK